MTPIIQAKNVSKEFLNGNVKTRVLHDINLTINEGEFVSIMGPSGSGKSTLLYLLAALDSVTDGSIYFRDQELSKMKDKQISKLRRNNMGFVFQFYNLVPNLTVKENVMVPVVLDKKGMKEYEERFSEIMEIVGLSNKIKHTPRELSGGQQQRVAIARALITNPDLIIADEPIGNLDSKSGKEIMELLQKINREQHKTIVQVTHSLESTAYGTRIVHIKDGQIVESRGVET